MTQQYPSQYPPSEHPAPQPPPYGQPAAGASYPQPGYGPQTYAPPPPPPQKRRRWPWLFLIPVLLVVIVALVSNGGGNNSGGGTGSSSAAGSAPPAPAKAISARDWQLIAKDPASHTGERVIVYGQVTQFDAATGTHGFRANVDGVEHQADGGFAGYTTNTVLDGDADALRQVVQGDLFKAEVTVKGAKSYDTTMGGSTTVPELTVTKIDVTGHAG